MGRITGNFLSGLLTPKTGGDNLTAKAGGELSGNSAVYSRRNQGFNPAARFGTGDENKSSGDGGVRDFLG